MKLPFAPNPWVILGVVLALVGVAGGSYWRGRIDGGAAEVAKHAAAESLARAAADAVAQDVAKWLGEHKGNTTVINQKAREIVRENTVYLTEIPPDMQRLIEEARKQP